MATTESKNNRLTPGELLSNDRLTWSVGRYGLLRLALASLKGRGVSGAERKGVKPTRLKVKQRAGEGIREGLV